MGYRFRKSINVGGLRINFSKNGVGYSMGTKGYRITKTVDGKLRQTFTISGTGISYVEDLGNVNSHPKNKNRNKTDTGLSIKAKIWIVIGIVLLLGIIGKSCNSDGNETRRRRSYSYRSTASTQCIHNPNDLLYKITEYEYANF